LEARLEAWAERTEGTRRQQVIEQLGKLMFGDEWHDSQPEAAGARTTERRPGPDEGAAGAAGAAGEHGAESRQPGSGSGERANEQSNADRIRGMRRAYFADVDALVASGTVKIPRG
jgi:hypothetical protein